MEDKIEKIASGIDEDAITQFRTSNEKLQASFDSFTDTVVTKQQLSSYISGVKLTITVVLPCVILMSGYIWVETMSVIRKNQETISKNAEVIHQISNQLVEIRTKLNYINNGILKHYRNTHNEDGYGGR